MIATCIFLLPGAVATDVESRMAWCTVPIDQFMAGDVFQWYFTRTTIDNANMVDTKNTYKYTIFGSRSQQLVVNNISLHDEGYYFCQMNRNGVLLSNIIPGACLYAYSK